jgi:16S rRNA (cytosine967-C5)-methyltransferase
MSSSAALRAEAARVLAAVLQGSSLDDALQIDPTLSAQERGFLRSLCFDSVRWYLRLDALLERLVTRPGQKLHPHVRALAIIGLCQLLYSQTPVHAAVGETVNAARVLNQQRAAGFINALLRRFLRERDALTSEVDRLDSARTAHPKWLMDQLARDWPEQYAAILDANNERPPFWIRVNTRRISGADYRRQLEYAQIEVIASQFQDEALCLARAVDVHALPGFAQGQVSIQDAAAQLAARLVRPEPGERILDACCAPGGKTGHLLELQPELAHLVAVDSSAQRLERVYENLQRLGLQANVIEGDAAEPKRWWDGERFDRVLLDVPCSATGVIRRHPDIKLLRRAEDIEPLAHRQAALLRATWPMLKSGGRLVYASCSALRAETTDVIKDFLVETADAQDVTPTALRTLGLEAQPEVGYRIAAGSQNMDGFYYAVLEKKKSGGDDGDKVEVMTVTKAIQVMRERVMGDG